MKSVKCSVPTCKANEVTVHHILPRNIRKKFIDKYVSGEKKTPDQLMFNAGLSDTVDLCDYHHKILHRNYTNEELSNMSLKSQIVGIVINDPNIGDVKLFNYKICH